MFLHGSSTFPAYYEDHICFSPITILLKYIQEIFLSIQANDSIDHTQVSCIWYTTSASAQPNHIIHILRYKRRQLTAPVFKLSFLLGFPSCLYRSVSASVQDYHSTWHDWEDGHTSKLIISSQKPRLVFVLLNNVSTKKTKRHCIRALLAHCNKYPYIFGWKSQPWKIGFQWHWFSRMPVCLQN